MTTDDALAALQTSNFHRFRIAPSIGGYQAILELATDQVWVVGLGETMAAALIDAAAKLDLRLNPPRSLFD